MTTMAFPTYRSCLFLVVLAMGCSRGPARIEVPDYSPDEIGAQVIAKYDNDSDGNLSADELTDVDSLKSAMKQLDTNGDAALSADEIATRIRFYQDHRAGLVSASCVLRRGGRPVAEAKVAYEPEEFMGESLVPAYGTTDDGGFTRMSVADEHKPGPAFTGVQPGFYRIRVQLADGTEVTEFKKGVEVASGSFNEHKFTLP